MQSGAGAVNGFYTRVDAIAPEVLMPPTGSGLSEIQSLLGIGSHRRRLPDQRWDIAPAVEEAPAAQRPAP